MKKFISHILIAIISFSIGSYVFINYHKEDDQHYMYVTKSKKLTYKNMRSDSISTRYYFNFDNEDYVLEVDPFTFYRYKIGDVVTLPMAVIEDKKRKIKEH